jgi:hypothetical protein
MKNRESSITKEEILFNLFIFLLFIMFFVGSFGFGARARQAPLLVSSLGLVLLIIQLLKDLALYKAKKIKVGQGLDKQLLMIVGVFIAYPVLSLTFGYLISSFLTVLFGLKIMKYKNKKYDYVIAALVSLLMYFIFSVLVQVPLPKGLFEYI